MSLPAIIYANPNLLKLLHLYLTLSMALVSGIAVSLSLWIVPILRRAKSTETKLSQFQHVIDMGLRYLQTNSRVAGALLLTLAVVYYNHPDNLNPGGGKAAGGGLFSSEVVASLKWWQSGHVSLQGKWVWYVVALCVVVPMGPYEENLIFPINDRLLKGMKGELDLVEKEQGKSGGWDGRFGDKRDQEVDRLINEWNFWHVGRIAGSFTCLVVLVWSGMDGRF